MSGVAYWRLDRWWRDPGLRGRRLSLAVGLYGVLAILLFVFMPANPDPITAPADLIWDFRILSLSGHVLFWVILGGTSVLLLKRFARRGMLDKAV